MTESKRSLVVAFVAGLLFALGLGLAGMTDPNKVLAFLDVSGDWDPSLALVMAGAIAIYLPVYRKLRTRGEPLLGGVLHLPTKKDVDRDLVLGSLLFGVGWGIAGLCPGPALVSLVGGSGPILAFGTAMVLGMLLQRMLMKHRGRKAAAQAAEVAEADDDCACEDRDAA